MGKGAGRIAKCLISGLALVLAVSLSGRAAEGAVGDVLQTVTIPPAAQCNQGTGTTSGSAVAIVQGSKVGVPAPPILLVITCVEVVGATQQVQLRFLDPGTPFEGPSSTATLKKTISVIFSAGAVTPDFGFQALALRADTGDLLACGTAEAVGTVLYAIDISIFNNTPPAGGTPIPDGTATFLRSGPATSTCAGV